MTTLHPGPSSATREFSKQNQDYGAHVVFTCCLRYLIYGLLFRMCYISLPFYIAGLIISGFAFQDKLPLVAVVFGWGVREVAVMTTTVAVCGFKLLMTPIYFLTHSICDYD